MTLSVLLLKIEASTRTNIDETRHPELDIAQDSAQVVNASPYSVMYFIILYFTALYYTVYCTVLYCAKVVTASPPPLHKHPHLGPGSRSHSRDRDVFAWRKVSSFDCTIIPFILSLSVSFSFPQLFPDLALINCSLS